jgi:hypothetical protein
MRRLRRIQQAWLTMKPSMQSTKRARRNQIRRGAAGPKLVLLSANNAMVFSRKTFF